MALGGGSGGRTEVGHAVDRGDGLDMQAKPQLSGTAAYYSLAIHVGICEAWLGAAMFIVTAESENSPALALGVAGGPPPAL